MNQISKYAASFACLALTWTAVDALAQTGAPAAAASETGSSAQAQTHTIGAAKLIVSDLAATQAYYEQMFGMKKVAFYSSPNLYEEPIMGFGEGARLALFQPKAEAALKKSQYPVVLIYTPDFDALTKRIETAKHPLRHLAQSDSGTFRIAISRDPSGNAVEILSRPNAPIAVGGSKLIVNDRQKAEDFYTRVFNAKAGQRYKTAAYDEVIMSFGSEGPWLALFEPKSEPPLTKSKYAVVAIYTSDFDGVLKGITAEGLGFRKVESSTPGRRIIIAQDPAGNAIEIISR